jgi:hypothetical protein
MPGHERGMLVLTDPKRKKNMTRSHWIPSWREMRRVSAKASLKSFEDLTVTVPRTGPRSRVLHDFVSVSESRRYTV